ncbi:hypothetical protein CHS0354_021894 [Potamilus streckersoni]|uniref:Mdm2-binding protein n=1 Tax=Potamilus streckersoni TaxID=2493646 RepID=A0AAE0TJR1_9BIVA|nr:hypothetical protein CHS0354_021894 [Potamilus streckersoni]
MNEQYTLLISKKEKVNADLDLVRSRSQNANERNILIGVVLTDANLTSTWQQTEGNNNGQFPWKKLEEVTEDHLSASWDSDRTTENELSYLTGATEALHLAADSLPYIGASLDVYIGPLADIKASENIPFLGALRRLKDWHNAAVYSLDTDSSNQSNFLSRFLSVNDLSTTTSYTVFDLWRGKLSITEKLENKGFIIPGFRLTQSAGAANGLKFPLQQLQSPNKAEDRGKTVSNGRLGRMLEVLDEIDNTTVPSFMMTSYVYTLSVFQRHPHAHTFLEYIQQNKQNGLLMRLPIYPDNDQRVLCEKTSLSTTSWKDSIIYDILFVQEPEEEYQDQYEFLYFLITSPDGDPSEVSAMAHLLRSPYEINGRIMDQLYMCSLLGRQEDEVNMEYDLESLPLLTSDIIVNIQRDISIIQYKLLQKWAAERKQKDQDTTTLEENLQDFLSRVRQKFLQELSAKLPKYSISQTDRSFNTHVPSELNQPSTDWNERHILVYQESQKRCLTRLQSSESMAMSSPIQPSDNNKTIDVEDFLKFFKPDGSASAQSLSPVRIRRSCRSGLRPVSFETMVTDHASVPEKTDSEYHDIYYNTENWCEKLNKHCNKLQERHVSNETYSSYSQNAVSFSNPKCNQKKEKQKVTIPRRSPRKRHIGAKSDDHKFSEKLPEPIKSRKSASSVNLTQYGSGNTLRLSFPNVTPSPRRLSLGSQIALASRQNSEQSGSLLTSTPVPKQVEKLCNQSSPSNRTQTRKSCRESVQGTCTTSFSGQPSQPRKESRSERHTRKLKEIVEKVLKAGGMSPDDPLFSSCASRLFKVTKLYVMDLPTSRNLSEEMEKIAKGQVKQVIELETRRQKTNGK